MHITKAAKGMFIMANYVTAVMIPPHIRVAMRVAAEEKAHADSQGATSSSIESRDDSSSTLASRGETPADAGHIFARAYDPKKPKRTECPRCREKKCPRNMVENPKDCKRCVKCKPGTKPDPTHKQCIPDKPEEDDKKKRREEKGKKYEETRPQRRRQWKNTKYPKAQEKHRRAYEEREKIKRDNEKRKKVRRAGRCLPLVALAMGAGAAAEFADDFFDEDFLESMDLLELWPDDVPVAPWESEEDDKFMEEDEFVDKWVEFGNNVKKRSVDDDNFTDVVVEMTEEVVPRAEVEVVAKEVRDVSVGHQNEERFLQFLIPIFIAAAGTAARVGARAASAVGRALSKTTIKIAKEGKSKKSRGDQLNGAKKIRDNPQWKNCLRGQGPQ